MNHCVDKILLGLFVMLPVLAAGGCDSSQSPLAAHSGGASAGHPATGGVPGAAGHTTASSLATGGAPGIAGATGAAGASSQGGIGAGGVSTSGGVTTAGGTIDSGGATESGGTSAGGTATGGKTGSAGATGSSGGVKTSGGATTAGGATTSGGITGTAGAGGKNTGGTAAGGNSGSAGTGGTKPTGGTTPTGGTGTASTGSAPSGTPVSVHGQLKVVGNQIVDQNGKVIALHGMSMYPWNTQGTQFYNASAVGHLAKDLDCAILRIPILPNSLSTQTPLVQAVVDACIANGIYAIIDWHGSTAASAASTFFASMATAYGNTPNVMYEIWNEPSGVTWPTIKTYHETVVAAIRAIDPDNIILLGTPNWDQQPNLAAADPVTTSTNLAYTFHFYAYTHKFAAFGSGVSKALASGIAIFVTEYGGCASTGNGTFDATELQTWWDFLDTNNIGCTNWSVETNGETSAIFTTTANKTGPWTTAEITNPDGTTILNYIQSKYAATVAP
ncbi:MAG: glycoside hydrolase family 5 protein [Polyangia bacterium]